MIAIRAFCATVIFASCGVAETQPIALHPDNPHYYVFRGKPTVLVSSTEHYGAVINSGFDYRKYLDTLAADGLNLTRTFAGTYRENPGSFNISKNTLAPDANHFVSPWMRSSTMGAADGLNKWDLNAWNPAFFARLKDFVSEAGKRGIIVELTLFCTFYDEKLWANSPLNGINNVQAIGTGLTHEQPFTLKDPHLQDVQDQLVRRIADTLRDADNVIYEICNEPYFGGVTLEWQKHIATVLSDSESKSGRRHLTAQNIANNQQKVTGADPNVSVFNFHYARPPIAVEENYALNKVIGFDETGFDGTADFVYRIEGWDFLFAGGAHYDNLDYSFTAGHEDGTYGYPGSQPGGGSTTLRKQLGTLLLFFKRLDFTHMRPDPSVIEGGIPQTASAHVLANSGREYAIYIHHGEVRPKYSPSYAVENAKHTIELKLAIPDGVYVATWWDPKSGKEMEAGDVTAAGGRAGFRSPEYKEDIAVQVRRK
jgi:hypothetical protein